jgi:hypothetical protein
LKSTVRWAPPEESPALLVRADSVPVVIHPSFFQGHGQVVPVVVGQGRDRVVRDDLRSAGAVVELELQRASVECRVVPQRKRFTPA